MLVGLSGSMVSSAQAGNAALQGAVSRAMAGHRGAAAVVDVRSGRLLAVYHPEIASRRVVRPGSSLKPFTLLTLLDADKVDAHTALLCKRPLTIGGHKLDCPHPATNQPFEPPAALAYSCNFYFTNVSTRLTATELHDSLVRMGFTAATGWLPHEAGGRLALARTRDELQLQAIGEWGVDVTPLELLRAYRQLALLSQRGQAKLAPLFEGLEQSVSYGMAHMAEPSTALRVAGKTGTALAEEGRWTHGWFAGYAPAARPEIVLVVYLEHGRGPTDAALVARQIFDGLAKATVTPTHTAAESGRP